MTTAESEHIIKAMPCIVTRMRSVCNISDKTLLQLASYLTPCTFPKKHKLIVDYARCRYAYFMENGLTRSYWLFDGQEITTSFSTSGAIVFSMDELYYNIPSQEYVETIEPCQAFRISIDDLRHLFDTNIEMANWGRIIHQDEYRRLHRSHKERLTLPARDRYEAFSLQFPEICQKVPLGYIASYLGLTLPTLSRIRRNNLSYDKF